MADLNTVTLSGNLVRDPELRSTPAGKAVTSLRLGTKGYGDKSLFTDVTVWEGNNSSGFNLAEVVAEAFSKGDRFVCTGRLEYREWEKDGVKRSAHSVVAQDVILPKRGEAATDTSGEPDF